ncbi:lipopolysaccharide heptosyltransferase family protein [bacterium]|nr:MAG: lipopolysaccharide heptosyltransferase family protein [bacterium]
MERFLIIQLRALGDVVLATALARIIKELRPGAFVGFLTQAPNDAILLNNPGIDKVFTYFPSKGLPGQFSLIRDLRRHSFDTSIDALCTPGTEIFSFFSGAKVRAGFYSKWRSASYTERVKRSSGYAVETKKTLLSAIGLESGLDRPEIFLTPEEKLWGEACRKDILKKSGNKKLFTVDATHKHAYRRWSADGYANLCKIVSERYGATGVALWGPGERDTALSLEEKSGGTVVASPETTLRTLSSLIASADFHLGNCSAPRHIAVAVGTPTFIIPGTSQNSWRYPSGEHGEDPYKPPCGDCKEKCFGGTILLCMEKRSAKEVAEHALPFLDKLLETPAAGDCC